MNLPNWVKNYTWAAIFWIVACFVLFLIADKVVLPIVAGQLTSTAEVPQVEGLQEAQAMSALEEAGLEFAWREEGKYSSTIAEGAVLTQLPAAGREVKSGRKIYLTRSLGKRKVSLPDLRGESKRQGQVTLQRLGVVEGSIEKGYHASIPRGVVIRTIPQEGTMVRIGDTVSLVISSGRQDGLVLLPKVSGSLLGEAQVTLEDKGFTIGKIEKKASDQHLNDTVLDQYPKHGEYLAPGTEIILTVVENPTAEVKNPTAEVENPATEESKE